MRFFAFVAVQSYHTPWLHWKN